MCPLGIPALGSLLAGIKKQEVYMRIRKTRKKLLALLLMVSAVLALLTGCRGGNEENQSPKDASGTMDGTGSVQQQEASGESEESHAKGRYLEHDLELPEEVSRIYDMQMQEDGGIGLLDMTRGLYVSEDSGQTWTLKEDSFVTELGEAYVARAALSSDGRIFAFYVTSGGEGQNSSGDGEASGGTDNAPMTITYNYCLIGSDGTFTKVYLKDEGMQEKPMESTAFLSDGTILLSFETTAYALQPDTGELSVRFEAQNNIASMREIGNYFYVVTADGIQCFDLETGVEIVDQVLAEQSKEFLVGETVGSTDNSYALLACAGDTPDTVCLASSKGLYRHVTGGTVMEEAIKGELSALSNPSLELQGLEHLPDDSFLIAYTGSAGVFLKHYTYDSEASAVPEHKLTVYSLDENQGIRMAIVEYQKSHPDTYVAYETGMTGTDGVTREDAIRNLNTAILSGEGPDILVLDGLPVTSYMEKGILEDLSPLFEDQLKGQEYFEDIINIYEKDGTYMALPSRFQFPVIMGDAKVVDAITDLNSFADAMKSLRSEWESGSLLGAYTEEGILRLLYEICVPAWIEEDGTIKKEGLVTFLAKAKEIYEMEIKGLSPEEIATWSEMIEERKEFAYFKSMGEAGWNRQFLNVSFNAMGYLEGRSHLMLGLTSRINGDYSNLTSMDDQFEQEQKIKAFDGQGSGVFLPNTILGINSQGSGKKTAFEFVASVLSEENQGVDNQTGYPVQKAAFDSFLENTYYGPDNEDSEMYSTSWSSEDGQSGGLTVRWPSEAHLGNLKTMAEGLTTASITDYNLRDAVLDLAPDALNGTKDVESVANEIINKMQIYLSE